MDPVQHDTPSFKDPFEGISHTQKVALATESMKTIVSHDHSQPMVLEDVTSYKDNWHL